MLKAAILGGLFIGILSALPIVSCCCCLWIIAGGMLAAYIDQQNDPRPTTVGRGAGVGALAGVIGAFVWIPVAMMLGALMAPIQNALMAEIARNARDMPPEARQWIDALTGPGGSSLRYASGFAIRLCAGAVFAGAGGMLGAAFFRNDVPPALGGTYVPPPPPPPTDRW